MEETRNMTTTLLSGAQIADVASIKRISTGFKGLDKATMGGIYPGLTLIASCEGTGKSTLRSQLMAEALDQGHRIWMYSGEMSDEAEKLVLYRQIAGRDGIVVTKTQSGADFASMTPSTVKLIDRWIGDRVQSYSGRPTWKSIMQSMSEAAAAGMDVFIIDNLMTLVSALIQDGTTRDEYAAQGIVATELADFAKKHDCWVLLVTHTRKEGLVTPTNLNDQISGNSAVKNLASIVIFYSMPTDQEVEKYSQYGPDALDAKGKRKPDAEPESQYITRDDRMLRVTKNRLPFCRTETAGIIMRYDRLTGRIYEDYSTPDQIYGWMDDLSEDEQCLIWYEQAKGITVSRGRQTGTTDRQQRQEQRRQRRQDISDRQAEMYNGRDIARRYKTLVESI